MLHLVGQPFECSNCRKQLVFKTEKSNCLICSGCQTINYRLALPEKAGPVAEKVKEDMSILRVGSTGVYGGKKFEVIGRIQYFFQDGYRNHWNLIFSNNESAWLGDWAGNYSIFQEINGRYTDRFRQAAPGKKIELLKIDYEVEKLDEHRLTFAEGEFPDHNLEEKNFITIHLTHPTGAMALANIYDKKKADSAGVFTNVLETYSGNYVELSALNLQNLRLHDEWC